MSNFRSMIKCLEKTSFDSCQTGVFFWDTMYSIRQLRSGEKNGEASLSVFFVR